MFSIRRLEAILAAIFTLLICCQAAGQEPAQKGPSQPKIDWQAGPTTGQLGDIAEIKIPKGYSFTGKQGTETLLEMTHNIPSGHELGALVPNADDADWFMTFEFEDTGYVKDDEKDKLDAAALLKSMQEGTEEENEQRRQRGWKGFHVIGWEKQPFYDPLTHNLTWAIQGRGDDPRGDITVNHSIRLLGRKGTVSVDLVASSKDYTAGVPAFNSLISGFSYKQGSRYADFTAGDKVAEYGLGALIVGGAGAVALKTGFLAKFWKVLVAGLAALVGAVKKLFKSVFGNEDKIQDPQQEQR